MLCSLCEYQWLDPIESTHRCSMFFLLNVPEWKHWTVELAYASEFLRQQDPQKNYKKHHVEKFKLQILSKVLHERTGMHCLKKKACSLRLETR